VLENFEYYKQMIIPFQPRICEVKISEYHIILFRAICSQALSTNKEISQKT